MIPEFKFALTAELEKKFEGKEYIEVDGQKLTPESFLPTKFNPTDSGFDVRSSENIEILPGCYTKIKLGIKALPQIGWWLSLSPRSSTFIKKNMHALYGIIDEGYQNELCFCSAYLPDACILIPYDGRQIIKFGERIGQLVPVPRQEMQVSRISNEEMQKLYDLRNDSRKEGGFGSSGKI